MNAKKLVFLCMGMVGMFAFDDALALTVTGGSVVPVISSTSGVVALDTIEARCDFNGEINAEGLLLGLSYTSNITPGAGANPPVVFDSASISGITAINFGTIAVATPPLFDRGLFFNNSKSCMTGDRVRISGAKLKLASPAVADEGTIKVHVQAASGIPVQSSAFSNIDTKGPVVTDAKVIDNGSVGEGKPSSWYVEFDEDIIYPVVNINSDWTISMIDSVYPDDIGALVLSKGKGYGLNTFSHGATAASGVIASYGSWNVTPTASNPLTDLYGNKIKSQTFMMLDDIEPVVKSVSPSQGSSMVALNQPIVVNFSEAINPSAYTVSISPNVPFTKTLSNNFETLTITPSGQAYGTSYTVTLTGNALNGGHALATTVASPALPRVWSYSTASQVVTYNPNIAQILVNGGSSATSNNTVQVTLTAQDAQYVRFANNSGMTNATAYETYVGGKVYSFVFGPSVLSGNTYTVCAEVKAQNGATSNVMCDTITVNTNTAGSPKNVVMNINNGAAKTDTSTVMINLSTTNATHMAVSESPTFQNATWETYSTPKIFGLSSGLGVKTVYVKLMSASKEVSLTTSASIERVNSLTVSPSISYVKVSSGTSIYSAVQVTATGADYIRFANNTSMTGATAFQSYGSQSYYNYTLNPFSNSGTQPVCAQVKGSDGSLSPVVCDYVQQIFNAGSYPTNTFIAVSNGASETTDTWVQVSLSAVNATQMAVSENPSFDGVQWETYNPSKWLLLSSGTGTKYVYVQFASAMGNVSSQIYDTIYVNTPITSTTPTGVLSINNGASTTSQTLVTLNLSYSNAHLVRFATSGGFYDATAYESVSSGRWWQLPSGNGSKTVCAQFYNSTSGLTSAVTCDSIELYVATNTYVPPTSAYVVTPAPATPSIKRALPSGITAGMLVKKAGDSAVYYVGEDGYRYVFPHQNVFLSWYTPAQLNGIEKGGLVITIAKEKLGQMMIGGNVTYRPGLKLVKIQSDSKVYAVDKGGILRWLTSDAVAQALYGYNWSKQVQDISDAFFVNYGFGTNINTTADYDQNNVINSSISISLDKKLTAY